MLPTLTLVYRGLFFLRLRSAHVDSGILCLVEQKKCPASSDFTINSTTTRRGNGLRERSVYSCAHNRVCSWVIITWTIYDVGRVTLRFFKTGLLFLQPAPAAVFSVISRILLPFALPNDLRRFRKGRESSRKDRTIVASAVLIANRRGSIMDFQPVLTLPRPFIRDHRAYLLYIYMRDKASMRADRCMIRNDFMLVFAIKFP